MANAVGMAIILIAGIPLGTIIILGAQNGNGEMMAAGIGPLAAALGAVVDHYFADKAITTLKAKNKALEAKLKEVVNDQ
jgi:hypothetical protein